MHFRAYFVSSPFISIFVSIISCTVISLTGLSVRICRLLLDPLQNQSCASLIITTVIFKIGKTKCVIKCAIETHKHSHQSDMQSSAGVKGGFVSGVKLLLGFYHPVNSIGSPQDDSSGEIMQFCLALANIFCQQIVDHCSANQSVS